MTEGLNNPVPRERLTSATRSVMVRTAKALAEYGQRDAAQLMEDGMKGTHGSAQVVVVGEVKRGKSTLVNALAGRVVTPMGIDVVTAGVIVVTPPTDELPVGRAKLVYLARDPEIVPSDDLLTLLSPSTDEGPTSGEERPVGATVAVDQHWLAGTALVDTPGVGGLNAVHGQRARAAVRNAGALLFVSDGGQALTKPELDFLHAVSSGIEFVLFALTKIDRTDGWESVMAENRELLARHAPRFANAPIYPVAAALQVAAWDQPPDIAAVLEQSSRVAHLAAGIQDVVANRDRVVVANAFRAGLSGLSLVDSKLEQDLRARHDPAVLVTLDDERIRLTGLQDRLRFSRLDLERDLGRVKSAAVAYMNDGSDSIAERLSVGIRVTKRGGSAAIQQQFDSDLEAEMTVLAARVRDIVQTGFGSIASVAFADLADPPTIEIDAPADLPALRIGVRRRPTGVPSQRLDPAAMASSAFMGSQLASLVGWGGPLGIVVAGGWIAVNLATRGGREGKQHMAATLNESVAVLKRDLATSIDASLREFRHALNRAVETHLDHSIAELKERIGKAEAAARVDSTRRQQEARDITRKRENIAAQQELLEQRLRGVLADAGTSSATAASNKQ